MSKQHVLTFLREWLAYSTASMKRHKLGAEQPHSRLFRPFDGLCGNLDRWAWAKCPDFGCGESFDAQVAFARELSRTLKSLFREDKLCPTYPFGERSFQMRHDLESNYRCPNRRRWVKKTIAKLEQELSDGNN